MYSAGGPVVVGDNSRAENYLKNASGKIRSKRPFEGGRATVFCIPKYVRALANTVKKRQLFGASALLRRKREIPETLRGVGGTFCFVNPNEYENINTGLSGPKNNIYVR